MNKKMEDIVNINTEMPFDKFKKTYKWVIGKWEDTEKILNFSGYITERRRKYEKRTRCGKWYLVEDDTNEISGIHYMNSVDAHQLPIFSGGGRETIAASYTYVGNIPTTITSYSPDGSIKIVRDYRFEIIR